jgi:hypothetical protein
MTEHDRDLITFRVAALETAYWYEIDHNWGRGAAEMYVPDGAVRPASVTARQRSPLAMSPGYPSGRRAGRIRPRRSFRHQWSDDGRVSASPCRQP